MYACTKETAKETEHTDYLPSGNNKIGRLLGSSM